MNFAEQQRNRRIAQLSDLALLRLIVEGDHGEDVSAAELPMFIDWLAQLTSPGSTHARLSSSQREHAREVARRILPLDAKQVPRGQEVPTPAVLQNLPKKPPRRSIP